MQLPTLTLQKLLISLSMGLTLLTVPVTPSIANEEKSLTRNDPAFAEAFDNWMLRAYEGDRDAQFKVALMFSDGTGTQQDPEQAVYWYSQAARQGLASAQYNLGHKYLAGQGTDKDLQQAIKWWLKAAKQEHELAQFNVARAYYGGIGVDKDEKQAKFWFRKAAINNEPRSIEIMRAVYQESPSYSEPQTDLAPKENMTLAMDQDNQAIEPESSISVVENQSTELENIEPSNTENRTTQAPIAVYNRPDKMSVLVFLMPSDSRFSIVKQNEGWLNIQSDNGFPVWVYKDFVILNNDATKATIKGNNVNARAVPLILRGSVIGQLFDGTQLRVLEQQEKWIRLQSPNNFSAWIENNEANISPSSIASSPAEDAQAESVAAITEITADNAETPTLNNHKKDTAHEVDIAQINQIDASSSIQSEQVKYSTSSKESTEKSDSKQAKPTQSGSTTEQEKYVFKNVRNDDSWLFSLPEKSYTLQLASFADDKSLFKFLKQFKLQDDKNARQFISNRNGIEWKYVLYGSYATTTEAEAAKTQKKFKRAWVRNVGQIRKNRCIAWKTTIPTPKGLKTYCQD